MLISDADDDTGSPELNVETAAPVFERFLSLEEDPEKPETPPTQNAPESEKPETPEDEASSEPADGEQGNPAETEQTEQESPEDPATATLDPNLKLKVKVNGEEREETLEEILKGYSRTQDYTRKTQEIATQRKTFEAEAQAVRSERQMYASQLVQLEQVLKDATPQEPDWAEIQRSQPAAFGNLYAQWSAHEKRMAEVSAERERAQQAVMADQAQERQRYLQAEQEKLLEAFPEWKNPESATTAKTAMVGYVKNMGYTVEELSQVTDHRLIKLIDKAMKWDAAQAKKPTIQARIEKVKTATPGPASGATPPGSVAEKARQRLAKTGRQEDAAAAFERFLED
jgi:hypothetical protein